MLSVPTLSNEIRDVCRVGNRYNCPKNGQVQPRKTTVRTSWVGTLSCRSWTMLVPETALSSLHEDGAVASSTGRRGPSLRGARPKCAQLAEQPTGGPPRGAGAAHDATARRNKRREASPPRRARSDTEGGTRHPRRPPSSGGAQLSRKRASSGPQMGRCLICKHVCSFAPGRLAGCARLADGGG